jgi:hypothetical protein
MNNAVWAMAVGFGMFVDGNIAYNPTPAPPRDQADRPASPTASTSVVFLVFLYLECCTHCSINNGLLNVALVRISLITRLAV